MLSRDQHFTTYQQSDSTIVYSYPSITQTIPLFEPLILFRVAGADPSCHWAKAGFKLDRSPVIAGHIWIKTTIQVHITP